MRYPHRCKSIIDVTKAPYFADNTGKTDSTAAINQALDAPERPWGRLVSELSFP